MTSIHGFDSMWLCSQRSPTFSANEQRTASLTWTGRPVTTAMPPARKGAGASIWEFATTFDQPSSCSSLGSEVASSLWFDDLFSTVLIFQGQCSGCALRPQLDIGALGVGGADKGQCGTLF